MKKICIILGIAALLAGAAAPVARAVAAPDIHESAASTVELKVEGHRLIIENRGSEPLPVVIYALTGQIVKQLDAHPGVTAVDLSAGYYIVKADRLSKRIVIR